MSTNSDSRNDISLTWATPVNLAQLGARLTAYAETKAAITTLRLAIRDTTLFAFHSLPEEIIGMIASEVRDITFRQKMKQWVKIGKCLTNTCTTLSHLDQAQLEYLDFLAEEPPSRISKKRLSDKFFWESAAEEHQGDVGRYCEALSNLEGSSEVARSAQVLDDPPLQLLCISSNLLPEVFTQDFGIRPYFRIQKSYDSDWQIVKCIHAEAFLTLPLLRAPLFTTSGPRVGLFSFCSIIDPSTLRELSRNQLQQFKTATNILNLHPCSPKEDETLFGDNLNIGGASSSGWNTEPGGSEYGDDHSEDARSDAVTSEQASFQGHKTVAARRQEPDHPDDEGNAIGSSSEEMGHDRRNLNKKEMWPRLMIIGCGSIEAYDPS